MSRISLVIPTYNGASKLPRLFRSIRKQELFPDEIIVVIDGSTDDSLNWLSNQSILDVKIIVQKNHGRSIVRNNGALCAKNEILLFVDDDMELTPSCVLEHVRHHKLYPNSILGGAQIDPNFGNRTDFQLFKHFLSNRWSKKLLEHYPKPLSDDLIHLTAANMSLPRDLFWSLGGFNTNLSDAEDLDFAMKAKSNGINVYYSHQAFAFHIDDVTCESYIRRMRQYRLAQIRLIELNPYYLSKTARYNLTQPKGLKYVFFKIFSFSFWIKIIDRENINLLPRCMRYRLYDYVLTSNGNYFYYKVPL